MGFNACLNILQKWEVKLGKSNYFLSDTDLKIKDLDEQNKQWQIWVILDCNSCAYINDMSMEQIQPMRQWRHMSVKASLITGNSTVYAAACWGYQQMKHQCFTVLAFCAENSPITSSFLVQRPNI